MTFLEIKKFSDVSTQSNNTDLHLKAVFSCTRKLTFLVYKKSSVDFLAAFDVAALIMHQIINFRNVYNHSFNLIT